MNDGWDWELLVRQLAQVEAFEEGNLMPSMPLGLRNRRRIWRLVDEARPGDVYDEDKYCEETLDEIFDWFLDTFNHAFTSFCVLEMSRYTYNNYILKCYNFGRLSGNYSSKAERNRKPQIYNSVRNDF